MDVQRQFKSNRLSLVLYHGLNDVPEERMHILFCGHLQPTCDEISDIGDPPLIFLTESII